MQIWNRYALRGATAFAALALTTVVAGQTQPLEQYDVALHVDSGPVQNLGDKRDVIFSTVIAEPGAVWLRLSFDQAWLGGVQPGPDNEHEGLAAAPAGGQPTLLRITSLADGAQQTMNATHLEQWQYTSAYFNGDALLVEIIADPNAQPSQLVCNHAWAGPPDPGQPETICGNNDDRTLSYDNRSGRVEPVGCTGWRFDDPNRQFMMAGHCSSGGNADLIEFNVPLSDPGGNVVHPGPDDQYAIDPLSHQWQNGGVGDDWAYFGVFRNPNTGLTPYEAYGGYHTTSLPPAPTTQDIRITGYGSVSSPVSPTWNYVQKTHAGPYWDRVGTELRYRTDTTGGNSGSAVQNLSTGHAIGIHTHGGCDSAPDSYNKGTGLDQGNLQNALSNPLGVCIPTLCQAAGGCDEYIQRVQVGSIDNTSDCDRYHDYTALSTTMVKGQGYNITVTNGNLNYPSDQCGMWVDWNQDDDFDDAGEEMTVSGSPGVGPYTATITPPVGAANGNARLRIRITYTGAVEPCEVTTYGEVEDYTINVVPPVGGAPFYHCSARVTGTPNANTVFLFDDAGVYTNQSYPEAGTALTDAWGYRDGCADRSGHVYFGYGGGVYRHDQDGSNPTLMFDGTNAPGGTWRALAFDPTGDGGAGSFWSASFASDLLEVDLAGTILNTYPVDGWSLYGLAYDAADGNLWGHDAAGDVIKINTTTGANMGVQWTTGFANLVAQGGLSGLHDGSGELAAVSQGTPDELGVYDLSGTLIGGPWDMEGQTTSNGHLGVAVNVTASGGGEVCMGVNSESSATNNSYSKGNIVSVDTATVLTDISLYLENVPNGTNLWWAVYESPTVDGTFTKILEVTSSTGGGNGYFSSGPISAPLEVGMYYWIGGFWDQPVTYFFSNTMPGPPLYFNFGPGEMTYHGRKGAYSTLPGPPTFTGGGSAVAPYWQCYTLGSGSGCSNIMWDEAVDGDLADVNTAPTPMVIQTGDNCVIGSVGGGDDDFFRFTVPAGKALHQVVVNAYSSNVNTTFIGVNQGPIYEPMANIDCYGWTSFGTPHIGTDILPAMGASNGNFVPPLPPGEYSWWIDEGTGPETYELNFVLGSGPPPCPEDINGDGFVDVLDLLALLAAWGAPGGPADVNGDGIVDVLDLLQLLGAWGPC